jgi:ketosteroid isomerase-like protein
MNTKQIAQQYFELWTSKQCERAGALMADDIVCVTPRNRYGKAKDLVQAITGFTQQLKSVRLDTLAVDGNDVVLVYDAEMSFGTLRTTELQRIEGGKVRSIELRYEAATMTRNQALQYFEAWTNKQYDRVRAMMADDLAWESPLNAFSTADDVMPGFKRFVDSVKKATLVKLAADGENAALLYDCEFPFGTIRMTTWLTFKGGKIAAVALTFDPTELKKAMAVKS